MSWHVYLLTCADGTLYCGVTSDLARRLAEHNGGPSGAGAKYTRARRPVALAAHAPCADKSAALRLELAVKKRPRAAKLDYLLAQPDATAGDPSAEKRPAEPLQAAANTAAWQAADALTADKADIRAAALTEGGAA
ncbi:GIY-YIG nuclease family protein [Humidesulfovibrio idahonensis]